MNKGIVAVIIIVLGVVCGYFIYNALQKSNVDKVTVVELGKGDFGAKTLALAKDGSYTLACEDAKELIGMINAINQDFVDNPSLDVEKDNMTPSMKKFEDKMNVLGKAIESKYAKDPVLLEEVYTGIGENVSNVFQISVMSHMGMLAPEKVTEFVDITFCGTAAPEGYVSPLEVLNQMMPTDDGMGGAMGGHGMGMPSDNMTPAHPPIK